MTNIKVDLPLVAIEPLFTALHKIRPLEVSKIEMKAIAVLKSALYFEIESMVMPQEERDQHKIEFNRLFEEHREMRKQQTEND